MIERAADVNLKERRPVILLPREAPYNRIHISNMLAAHDAGVTILPASPAFYHEPQTIEDLADFIVARVLNLMKIPQNLVKPWGEKRDD
jgi:4-hydroxy-3-polyprenylbenzoate decarboxylase